MQEEHFFSTDGKGVSLEIISVSVETLNLFSFTIFYEFY